MNRVVRPFFLHLLALPTLNPRQKKTMVGNWLHHVISISLVALAMATSVSASTTVNVVPTTGVSASSTITSNACAGAMWNCVNDPVGSPDGDATYVYKTTAATTGEHVLGFSGNITDITGITMHIIAATNGGVGTAQMLFYNNGVVAGTGGLKTLTSTYTEYTSPFTTQIASINDVTMKVVLTHTSGTGSLKYTAAWLEVTYGTPGTLLDNMETHLLKHQNADGSPTSDFLWSDGTGYKSGSCTTGACAGGSGGTSLTVTANVTPPAAHNGTATQISVSGGNNGYPSALEWVKATPDVNTDAARNIKAEWWVYLEATSANDPNTLEFDAFWGDGTRTAMWGSHCNFTSGNWEVNPQDGSPAPSWKTATVASTGAAIPCNLAKNTWYHITWELHHDPAANKIYYDKLTVGSTTYVLNKALGYKATNSPWRALGSQVQQDLNSLHEPFTEYVDDMAVTYW